MRAFAVAAAIGVASCAPLEHFHEVGGTSPSVSAAAGAGAPARVYTSPTIYFDYEQERYVRYGYGPERIMPPDVPSYVRERYGPCPRPCW